LAICTTSEYSEVQTCFQTQNSSNVIKFEINGITSKKMTSTIMWDKNVQRYIKTVSTVFIHALQRKESKNHSQYLRSSYFNSIAGYAD
jgi:hypothetical protein